MSSTARPFTHLHVHTDMSFLDGMGTVENLLTHAKGAGVDTVACSDHGTLGNAVLFSLEAKRHGIKPVLGLEAYVAFDGEIGHLTLLADGWKGWNSLLALNTLAHQSDFKKPAMTIDEILANADGLVALSGCIASPFHRLPFTEAKSLAMRFKRAFGPRFFAEHMFVGDNKAHTRPAAIAKDVGILGVVTNDAHFPAFEQADLHPILMTMRSGFCYDSRELYLKTWNEMLYAIKNAGWSEANALEILERTVKVGGLLSPVSLKQSPHLPYLGTTKIQLRQVARQSVRALRKLQGPRSKEYEERLSYEIDVVADMGFLDYFSIIKDVVDYAKKESVRIGPGRGSGAGSLLLYFLGVTHIDPIEHGLQFERFLNPERVSMPDVDIDFESERRQKILDYAERKFNAKQIATYSRYSHKSLVRDLGKYFNMANAEVEALSDAGRNSDEFEAAALKYPLFEESYDAFLGQVRHRGKHAGGVVITTTPVPIERAGGQLVAAWSEGGSTDLSYAGIVKFDFLGISVLTALRRLEEKHGCFAPYPIPNAPEFDIFKSGDLSGVFQFSGSDGIRRLTQRLQPSDLATLTAINALYRPGALASGATQRYPNPVQVPLAYEHALKETHGAIVYQEQVMEIYRTTVNGTLAEADSVRKVIAKPKPEDRQWIKALQNIKANFYKGCRDNLLFTKQVADHWWGELVTHSSYSFNKSHATAYAYVAWECAWWKWNYRGDFYAEMLNIDPGNQQLYVSEAVQSSFVIQPPDVQKSQASYWTFDAGELFMPLKTVKFMGEKGALFLEQERVANGPFLSLDNFMLRIPKKIVRGQARQGLWYLGGYARVPHQPGEEEILAIKEYEDAPTTQQVQLRVLGFTLPTQKQLQESSQWESQGYHCGTVTSVEERMGKRGPYFAVRLAPYAAFWTPKTAPKEGNYVAVKIGKRGKASDIRRIV